MVSSTKSLILTPITLLNVSPRCSFVDFSSESLTSLKQALTTSGFVPYSTVVGGRGFGVHLPSNTTSSVNVEEAEGGAELSGVPEGKKMVETRKEELGRWAEELGEWLYV